MNRPERILAVFDDCGPGDALCLSFCLSALRKAHPDAVIDLLVSARAWPVFEHAEGFGRVIVSNLYGGSRWPRPLARLFKAWEVARLAARLGRGYDLAVTFLWGTTAVNFLARWAARRSFGYSNKLPLLLTSRLGSYPPNGEPIELAIKLLAAAGVSATPEVPYIRFNGSRSASVGREPARPNAFVVVHVGSDWACQQWLPERWADVADHLVAGYGMEVVFTGLADESDYVEQIRNRMRQQSTSLVGQTTMSELTTLLSEAQATVCVDSSIYELAQAAGTPIVVLAGQSRTRAVVEGHIKPIVVNRTTPELRAAILHCKTSVVKASYGGCRNYSCPMAGLRDISIDDVLEAVEAQGVLKPRRSELVTEARA